MKFCPVTRARFRNDVSYMNEAMIAEWNEIVQPEDTTYILGDFAFLAPEKAAEIAHRLNGSKILIEGNHDHKLVRDPKFRAAFKEVHKYYELNYNGTKLVMFHYPISEWNQMHRGAVHLYGHLHGGTSGLEKYRARDVAMDATGCIVTDLDTIVADALRGEIKGHH